VHSRYRRRLADAPISGRPVELDLLVRRFFCDSIGCPARTFVEQVAGLTTPHARRTGLLRTMLEAIGLALAGRAGARLALCLGLVTSRHGLLRLVRALPDPPVGVVEVLGVDDFALRRGHVYGTVVLDMATHRPIDLLGDRTADTLAAWLREHPGVQVVCRDRAGAYAEGIRAGAPAALQVADRWHLWHNLTEAVEKTVIRHRADLHEPDQAAPQGSTDPRNDAAGSEAATDVAPAETRIVVRTRERYAAVQQNLAAGATLSAICRALRLDRKTVQRFARATSVEELLVKSQTRDSLLDAFKPYLHQRWNAGSRDAAALTVEIAALGYRGSDKTVRRYLRPFRAALVVPPSRPAAPTVRQTAGWLTRHPDSLTEDEQLHLKQVLARSPALQTTHQQVHEFAVILTQRRGERLPAWMEQIDTNGAPALRSFVTGLRTDLDAVTAGLTLTHNSGPVEGAVNRIKMIKRQMFGRAGFDLLRKRVLLAT
jgi:transposase